MEAAKCRLCGERHYGLCPSLKGEVISSLNPNITRKKFPKPALSSGALNRIEEVKASVSGYLSPNKTTPVTRNPGGCQCPCCTLRREKVLAAVKKFREKKRGK